MLDGLKHWGLEDWECGCCYHWHVDETTCLGPVITQEIGETNELMSCCCW